MCDTDGADEEAHAVLLAREHMLNRRTRGGVFGNRPRKEAGQMAASDYRQDPILLLHLLRRPQMVC